MPVMQKDTSQGAAGSRRRGRSGRGRETSREEADGAPFPTAEADETPTASSLSISSSRVEPKRKTPAPKRGVSEAANSSASSSSFRGTRRTKAAEGVETRPLLNPKRRASAAAASNGISSKKSKTEKAKARAREAAREAAKKRRRTTETFSSSPTPGTEEGKEAARSPASASEEEEEEEEPLDVDVDEAQAQEGENGTSGASTPSASSSSSSSSDGADSEYHDEENATPPRRPPPQRRRGIGAAAAAFSSSISNNAKTPRNQTPGKGRQQRLLATGSSSAALASHPLTQEATPASAAEAANSTSLPRVPSPSAAAAPPSPAVPSATSSSPPKTSALLSADFIRSLGGASPASARERRPSKGSSPLRRRPASLLELTSQASPLGRDLPSAAAIEGEDLQTQKREGRSRDGSFIADAGEREQRPLGPVAASVSFPRASDGVVALLRPLEEGGVASGGNVLFVQKDKDLVVGCSPEEATSVVGSPGDAAAISPKHLKISASPALCHAGTAEGDAFALHVTDLSSLGGVFLNDVKVTEAALRDGDVLALGGGANCLSGERRSESQFSYRFQVEFFPPPAKKAVSPEGEESSLEKIPENTASAGEEGGSGVVSFLRRLVAPFVPSPFEKRRRAFSQPQLSSAISDRLSTSHSGEAPLTEDAASDGASWHDALASISAEASRLPSSSDLGTLAAAHANTGAAAAGEQKRLVQVKFLEVLSPTRALRQTDGDGQEAAQKEAAKAKSEEKLVVNVFNAGTPTRSSQTSGRASPKRDRGASLRLSQSQSAPNSASAALSPLRTSPLRTAAAAATPAGRVLLCASQEVFAPSQERSGVSRSPLGSGRRSRGSCALEESRRGSEAGQGGVASKEEKQTKTQNGAGVLDRAEGTAELAGEAVVSWLSRVSDLKALVEELLRRRSGGKEPPPFVLVFGLGKNADPASAPASSQEAPEFVFELPAFDPSAVARVSPSFASLPSQTDDRRAEMLQSELVLYFRVLKKEGEMPDNQDGASKVGEDGEEEVAASSLLEDEETIAAAEIEEAKRQLRRPSEDNALACLSLADQDEEEEVALAFVEGAKFEASPEKLSPVPEASPASVAAVEEAEEEEAEVVLDAEEEMPEEAALREKVLAERGASCEDAIVISSRGTHVLSEEGDESREASEQRLPLPFEEGSLPAQFEAPPETPPEAASLCATSWLG